VSCSADVNASSFDVPLALQTLRIAIHRRKGATLKLLFSVVPFVLCTCRVFPVLVAIGIWSATIDPLDHSAIWDLMMGFAKSSTHPARFSQ
jgi:hypothetical protein